MGRFARLWAKGGRPFLILWTGQAVSLLGSRMTNFAIMLWAW